MSMTPFIHFLRELKELEAYQFVLICPKRQTQTIVWLSKPQYTLALVSKQHIHIQVIYCVSLDQETVPVLKRLMDIHVRLFQQENTIIKLQLS